MSSEKMINVILRLKEALLLSNDNEVANALGISNTAFAQRKLRDSVPVDKIKILCEREIINVNWVLSGEGQMKPQGVRQEDPVFFEAVFCRMMDRLKRIYKERDFKKLSALQSTLEVFDPGDEDEED